MGKDDGSETLGIGGVVGLGQQARRFGEIVDAVIVELPGDAERGLMWHRALAAIAQEPFSSQKTVRPHG